MTFVLIAVAVGLLTFGCGILGLLLQKRLPEKHMAAGSRDMIAAIIGLVTLLLALVLGTLVGSAYGTYALQKSELEALAAHEIQLDLALAQYGPDAQSIRDENRKGLIWAHDAFWGNGQADAKDLAVAAYLPALKAMTQSLASLNPTTPNQKQVIATIGANAAFIEQTRLLMSLQLASPVSQPMLIIVVSWALMLFCGFGVLSRLNATSIAAMGLGAFAIASAIFLILELNAPYTSLFRLSPAPLEQTIAAIAGE